MWRGALKNSGEVGLHQGVSRAPAFKVGVHSRGHRSVEVKRGERKVIVRRGGRKLRVRVRVTLSHCLAYRVRVNPNPNPSQDKAVPTQSSLAKSLGVSESAPQGYLGPATSKRCLPRHPQGKRVEPVAESRVAFIATCPSLNHAATTL